MTSSASGARPGVARHRVADLPLRGRAGPLRTRVHWPPSAGPGGPPLLVFLPAEPDDDLPVRVAASAGVVVLVVTDGRAHRQPDGAALAEATMATQWAADHAAELGADPRRILVGGEARGAWLAAAVALRAREDGWPPLVRQLLVLAPAAATDATGPTAARLLSPRRAPSLTGVAPAIILTVGEGEPPIEARRYASRLRSAGVGVDDLRHRGPGAAAAPRLAGVLRRALAVTEGRRP
jgi:acetyl esterase